MSAKQSLGRGMDALIPIEIESAVMADDETRVQKLLIQDIVPNSEQPRREFDDTALRELTASVKQHGVLQPIIVVRHKGPGSYRIVAGERRWRAAKAAGLKDVPSIVRSLEELEELEMALIENIQRVDLSPLEQALAVSKLQQQFNLKLDEVAKKLGKAPSTISNLTRLLSLPKPAYQALADGKLSEGHARAILALKDMPDKQAELLSCILDNGWTVRQAEQFAVQAKRISQAKQKTTTSAYDTKLTRTLSKKLGTNVRVSRKAKGGQLIISFSDDEQLGQISQKLGS
jgi:ParB family chromosome partitioning protein